LLAKLHGEKILEVMAGRLPGVLGHEPWIFILASLLLAKVGLAARCLPATSATRVDPMTALLAE